MIHHNTAAWMNQILFGAVHAVAHQEWAVHHEWVAQADAVRMEHLLVLVLDSAQSW